MDQLWREGDLQSLRGLIPELLAARDDTLARLRELQLAAGAMRIGGTA